MVLHLAPTRETRCLRHRNTRVVHTIAISHAVISTTPDSLQHPQPPPASRSTCTIVGANANACRNHRCALRKAVNPPLTVIQIGPFVLSLDETRHPICTLVQTKSRRSTRDVASRSQSQEPRAANPRSMSHLRPPRRRSEQTKSIGNEVFASKIRWEYSCHAF